MTERESQPVEEIDFHESLRVTSTGQLEAFVQSAVDAQMTDERRDGLGYAIRDSKFGIPCDVVEVAVTEYDGSGFSPEWIRIYRPVVEPMSAVSVVADLHKETDRDFDETVSFWIDFADLNGKEASGVTLELGVEHDEILVSEDDGVEKGTKSFGSNFSTMLTLTGLVNQNRHSIKRIKGITPPIENEFTKN